MTGDRAVAGLGVVIVGLLATATASAVVMSAGHAGASRGAGVAVSGAGSQPPSAPAGVPVRVRVPAIEVDAGLDRLGLDAGGALQVPPFDRAGWYEGGPRPGRAGRAVIAAHVDSTTGPAVFYRLQVLKPGDAVFVDYDSGTSVRFVVSTAETYPKSEFPTERVYGPTEAPSLVLITCAGPFDRRSQSYRDNLVVFSSYGRA